MTYAAVFPGQGAQEAGMGRELHASSEAARRVFEEADDALGFALSRIIFDGPDAELTKTANAQPAILVTSVAALRAFEEDFGQELTPAVCAGHSLGEYTALAAFGALSAGDAARLVRRRGELMQTAVPEGRGAMSAVLGLDRAVVAEVCDEASRGEVVCAANINSPNQTVISGDAAAVERAGELAKARGAMKVIPLKVSAPFHCALMRPVADALAEEFERVTWHAPRVPVAANVDAVIRSDAASIKEALLAQTYSPVLWADDVAAMTGAGAGAFVEFGPGSVLAGLIKRIAKGTKQASVGAPSDFGKAAEIIRAAAGGAA